MVHSKRVSAAETVRQAPERIESVNGALNAIVEHRPDEVLAAARRIDERISAGGDVGPLGSVPVTVISPGSP